MKKIMSVIVLVMLLTGCAVKWNYTPAVQQVKNAESRYTINVQSFSDARSDSDENDAIKAGKVILHWVPLVLWSNVTTVNKPEGNGIDMPSMTEVLPKNTATELANSGMFKSVDINTNKQTDYTLKGTVIQTLTTRSATSYGLSFVGTLFEGIFWCPAGNVKNHMRIKFELVNNKNGKVILSKEYHSSSWRPFFVYKLFSKSGIGLQSRLYQNINRQLVNDIEKVILYSNQ